MTIEFNHGETLFVGTLFKGKTDDDKPFNVIATWNTKTWEVNEVIFDDKNDNTDSNRQQVLEAFNSQVKR